MRFSLLTFFCASLLAGSLIGVYLRREPWVRDMRAVSREIDAAATAILVARDKANRETRGAERHWREAPDGRQARVRSDNSIIIEAPDGAILKRIESGVVWRARQYEALISRPSAVFADDDTLYIGLHSSYVAGGRYVDSISDCLVYRRRFPEYWWGAFFRVEVWTALLSCGALLALGVRALLNRRG